MQILVDYAKTKGKEFARRWFKINLAFAHRRAILKGVHMARDKILGCTNDANMEDSGGEAAASFQDDPILAF